MSVHSVYSNVFMELVLCLLCLGCVHILLILLLWFSIARFGLTSGVSELPNYSFYITLHYGVVSK